MLKLIDIYNDLIDATIREAEKRKIRNKKQEKEFFENLKKQSAKALAPSKLKYNFSCKVDIATINKILNNFKQVEGMGLKTWILWHIGIKIVNISNQNIIHVYSINKKLSIKFITEFLDGHNLKYKLFVRGKQK